MAIFAIGILALTKLQISSVGGNASARLYTEGSSWGTSQIEDLMLKEYEDASLDDGTTGHAINGIYRVDWTITDSVPVPNVKNIKIDVTWNDKGRVKHFNADYYKAIKF